MNIRDIYSKLYEFTTLATFTRQMEVVFANQLSNARPKKPFITISISNFQNIGTPIKKAMDDEGVQENTVSMLFTASFQCFSDKLHEAEDTLEDLHIKLTTELSQDIFKGEITTRRALLNTQSLPLALNEQNESRAVFEVQMAFNKTTDHEVGLIETIELSGIVDDRTQDITITK